MRQGTVLSVAFFNPHSRAAVGSRPYVPAREYPRLTWPERLRTGNPEPLCVSRVLSCYIDLYKEMSADEISRVAELHQGLVAL